MIGFQVRGGLRFNHAARQLAISPATAGDLVEEVQSNMSGGILSGELADKIQLLINDQHPRVSMGLKCPPHQWGERQ